MTVEIIASDGTYKYNNINQIEKSYKMENGKPQYYVYLYTKFSLNTTWKSKDIKCMQITNLEDNEFEES